MIITNWLAKGKGNYGLVFPASFVSIQTRIYGNVYGHPDFQDGEYVQTGIVTDYDGVKVTTLSGEKFTLLKEADIYLKYLAATYNDLTIMKEWKVVNGCLAGKKIDGTKFIGKVIRQSFEENVCEFADGRFVFVDWLSKDEDYVPPHGLEEFFVFGTERCMPDIFGKHFRMFKKY